jgi:hypothetical protein
MTMGAIRSPFIGGYGELWGVYVVLWGSADRGPDLAGPELAVGSWSFGIASPWLTAS